MFHSYPHSKILKKIPLKNENMFPLCKNCKYFLPANTSTGVSTTVKGYCKKTGNVNNLSGEVEYISSTIAREMICKGDYFIDKNTKIINTVEKFYQNNYNFDYKYFLD